MKLLSTKPHHILLICGLIVLANAILLPVMERTRMIEKVMAVNFSVWELLTISAFLGFRLAAYLLVPPLLAALGAYWLARRFGGRFFREEPSRNPEHG